MEITSRDNRHLKELRKAARGKSDLALIEGPKLIADALAAGVALRLLAVELGKEDDFGDLRAGDAQIIAVEGSLLREVSDVVTCQGIVALAEPRYALLEEIAPVGEPLIVIADGLQDPGNIGAVLRSAAAFGADALIALPGCADPWGAKAIRGSAGACFTVPVVRCDADEAFAWTAERGIANAALDARGAIPLWEYDFRRPCAIIVGGEGAGLSSRTSRSADTVVRIPISDRTESLNAAVAASVALYAASIQRSAE